MFFPLDKFILSLLHLCVVPGMNGLEGTIPEEIQGLFNLGVLDLGKYWLEGCEKRVFSFPMIDSNFFSMHVSGSNKLDGGIPLGFDRLTSLRFLNLRKLSLEGRRRRMHLFPLKDSDFYSCVYVYCARDEYIGRNHPLQTDQQFDEASISEFV